MREPAARDLAAARTLRLEACEEGPLHRRVLANLAAVLVGAQQSSCVFLGAAFSDLAALRGPPAVDVAPGVAVELGVDCRVFPCILLVGDGDLVVDAIGDVDHLCLLLNRVL